MLGRHHAAVMGGSRRGALMATTLRLSHISPQSNDYARRRMAPLMSCVMAARGSCIASWPILAAELPHLLCHVVPHPLPSELQMDQATLQPCAATDQQPL